MSFDAKNYLIIPIKSDSVNTNVFIGNNCLSEIAVLLNEYKTGRKCVLISNPKLFGLYGRTIVKACEDKGYTVNTIEVPDGEPFKNLDTIHTVLNKMASFKLERNSVVLALGGGVIGDMAGFAASIYLRGIPVVQIPTTLLSQVDSSIGGKTGVNLASGKNLVGTFYQPLFTFIDIQTLATLPQAEIRCGLAEIVKYGAINHKALFEYLESNALRIYKDKYTNDQKIWQHLIYESAMDKAQVVAKDEKESNLRAILNFGHTIGHAVEAVFNYREYLHGDAVAIGMKGAALIAFEMGMITRSDVEKLESLLINLGFDLKIKPAATDDIIGFLFSDKKIKDGKLRFVLPTEIGRVEIRDDVPAEIIRSVIEKLK